MEAVDSYLNSQEPDDTFTGYDDASVLLDACRKPGKQRVTMANKYPYKPLAYPRRVGMTQSEWDRHEAEMEYGYLDMWYGG